jgi:hypothetical protein
VTLAHRLGTRAPAGLADTLRRGQGWLLSEASARRRRALSPADALVVLGSGRSGTTWLQEVVGTLPTALPVWEPLNPHQDPAMRPLVPGDGFVRVAPDERRDDLGGVLDEVVSGRHLTRWSSSRAGLRSLWSGSTPVVKLIRANRAAGWLTERYPSTPVVAIVRHPCAVVSSMMSAPGAWNDWPRDEILEPMRGWVPDAALDAVPEHGRAGWLAAFWAADTLALLDETSPDRVHLVTYERMVRTPHQVAVEVFEHLGRPLPAAAATALGRASTTTNPGAAVLESRDPLAEWRRRLDPNDADAVLSVVEAFGLTFYGEDLDPDLDALSRRHRRDPEQA